jgi:hypothetical protein
MASRLMARSASSGYISPGIAPPWAIAHPWHGIPSMNLHLSLQPLLALLAGILILIRPNLTPLAALLGFWLLVLDRQAPTWRMRVPR